MQRKEQKVNKGFIKRLKEQWDTQYSERAHVSKQNIRDNALRFKDEMKRELKAETPVYIVYLLQIEKTEKLWKWIHENEIPVGQTIP